jgi:hypothetical protein
MMVKKGLDMTEESNRKEDSHARTATPLLKPPPRMPHEALLQPLWGHPDSRKVTSITVAISSATEGRGWQRRSASKGLIQSDGEPVKDLDDLLRISAESNRGSAKAIDKVMGF